MLSVVVFFLLIQTAPVPLPFQSDFFLSTEPQKEPKLEIDNVEYQLHIVGQLLEILLDGGKSEPDALAGLMDNNPEESQLNLSFFQDCFYRLVQRMDALENIVSEVHLDFKKYKENHIVDVQNHMYLVELIQENELKIEDLKYRLDEQDS